MNRNLWLKWSVLSLFSMFIFAGCATPPAATEEPAVVEQSTSCDDAEAAIAQAKAAIDRARAANGEWRDTAAMLSDAEAALQAGDCDKALALAQKAKEQAELGEQQALAEQAKMDASAQSQSSNMNDAYTVERGDSLWGISAKPEIYNNPYEWPLIYKANTDKIRDADLIYPGQEFTIERNASSGEVAAAVEHAKTRGAWSLGVVEASDKDYLNR